jgi:hypothetical protein
MANPDIVSVQHIYGETIGLSVPVSLGELIPGVTSKVIKVNCVYVSNTTASTANAITLNWKEGGNSFPLLTNVVVPASSTLIAISKNEAIYLEEGQSLEAINTTAAASAGDLKVVISYEVITDQA